MWPYTVAWDGYTIVSLPSDLHGVVLIPLWPVTQGLGGGQRHGEGACDLGGFGGRDEVLMAVATLPIGGAVMARPSGFPVAMTSSPACC